MIRDGIAGVFINLFNEHGEIITNKVTRFNYVHSDKLEDTSTIVIKLEKAQLVDHPNLQVNQRIIVVWGYTNEKEKAQKRILWIYDIDNNFTDMGVRITLQCMCKAGFLKFTERTGAGEMSLDDIVSEMAKGAGIRYTKPTFEPEQPSSVYFDINTRQRSQIGLSTKQIKIIDEIPNDTAKLEKFLKFVYDNSIVNGSTPVEAMLKVKKERAEYLRPKSRIITEYDIDPAGNQVAIDNTAYTNPRLIVFPGISDSNILDEQKKRSLVHDLQVTGRDDEIFVSKRNWGQSAYKSYSYKEESGYLLKFLVSTHNKESKKQGSQIDFSSVNPFDKSIQRSSVDGSNDISPALGQLIELTNEGLAKLPAFSELETRVSGLKKVKVTGDPSSGTPVVSYSDAQFVNKNSTYVAVTHIRGTRKQIDEYDKSMFFADKVPEKYSKPSIAGALGYSSDDKDGLYAGRRFTEKGRLNNSTHIKEGWDGKGTAVVTRLVPVNVNAYIQLIEKTIEEAAQTAYNILSEEQLKLREASADMIGDPSLISGRIISISNVGSQWSGNYYIHSVQHQIDSRGYVCKCELYKNSINKVHGLPDNLINASDLGIPTNTDIAASEAKSQGGDLKTVREEERPGVANEDT